MTVRAVKKKMDFIWQNWKFDKACDMEGSATLIVLE